VARRRWSGCDRVFISAGGSGVKFGARSGRRAGLGAKAPHVRIASEIRPVLTGGRFSERGFWGEQNGEWKTRPSFLFGAASARAEGGLRVSVLERKAYASACVVWGESMDIVKALFVVLALDVSLDILLSIRRNVTTQDQS
jgi:hypothetical protein